MRLLGLLGGLSIAMDMGVGAPLEESLRRCVVAARLARSIGSEDSDVSCIIYASLLQHLGCTASAHEIAGVYGDDVAATRAFLTTDSADPFALFQVVPQMARATGRPRARVFASALTGGRRISAIAPTATCEVARDAAGRLGLREPVQTALWNSLARWDGRGFPTTGGAEIPFATRVLQVASLAVQVHLVAGPASAMAELGRRSGGELDPHIVEAFSPELLTDIDELDAFDEVLDAEPPGGDVVDDQRLIAVASTFGDLVDLKSPWLHGHSAGVAETAAAAAPHLGLDAQRLRLSGHLHDLGRIAVPSSIWDKSGRLSATERSLLELHGYHSEQILRRSSMLDGVAILAGQHHERVDGSGYHRGLRGPQLSRSSRLLAAADRYRTLTESRPHRPAVPHRIAAQVLGEEGRTGRLDPDAVAAVVRAHGHPAASPRMNPRGLTARQVEVLRLMSVGMSNADIADRLVISRRTAEHHVQDIYLRIGSTSRAAAALFAMEHGLLGPQ